MIRKIKFKDEFFLCLWSIAIIAAVPFFFGKKLNFSSEIQNASTNESMNAEDVFAEEDFSENPLPENASIIIPADLSGKQFENQTGHSINESNIPSYRKAKENFTVLIIHTYGTQGYCKEGYITKRSTLKTEIEAENVVGVGNALAEALNQLGINTIHDKTMYDKISYSGAYNLSTEAVRNYMENDPSIKFVIDIQRSSLLSQNGSCIKAVTTTKKGKTAQIFFKSGSDENGADFPNWEKNLSLSYAISKNLYEINPKLSCGVTLLPSGYGQYANEGYITVEIGTAGNTPKEAENAAELLAEAFFKTVK